MKRINYLLIVLILGINVSVANPVTPAQAQKIAESFCKKYSNAKAVQLNLSLSHTETLKDGTPAWFVFKTGTKAGFIIVAADDAAHPIIGYSFEDDFAIPNPTSNIANWLGGRSKEIEVIRQKHLTGDAQAVREWKGDFGTSAEKGMSTASTQTVAALCQTKWNQSPYYNQLCPGGSVTGCVATAMSQIMRFWSYPAMGTGSSSYTAGSYGTLSANYGATTYSWSAMPNTIASNNTAVATINYHTGVSVEMNYSPSGSGAYVITADNPVCAQSSFVNYFKYDPSTIQGLYRSSYTDANWIALLENDLNLGQPVQYVGADATAGGHTWVCDGYDATNKFHMNWGWGGSSNGFYDINNLTGGGYNFSQNNEALIGIKPMAVAALDAGVPAVSSPIGTICGSSISPVISLKNFGSTTLTSCTINYKVDNGTVSTQSWSGSLANGASSNVNLPTISCTAGSHTLTVYTSNPNGSSDGNANNDQSTAAFSTNPSGLALPLQEGFEASANLPTGWSLVNPDADAAWSITTVAKTGSRGVGFNNCDGDGATDMTGRVDKMLTSTYNFSNAATAQMSFDVAYAVLTYSGTTYNDKLDVLVSTDCGTTWTNIYSKSGATLASSPTYTSIASCWVPASASDWRNDVITLGPSVLGQSNVMFAFQNTSAWGTWIYLDNINIAQTTTGISSHNGEGFNLYPNPASGSFTMEVSGKATYSVINMTGQEVKSGTITTKETLSTSDMAGGVYFVKVSDSNGNHIRKLVVE